MKSVFRARPGIAPGGAVTLFQRPSLIVRFTTIASSRIETADEITHQMKQVLQLAWQDRLVATPDCDLGFLGPNQQRQSFVPLRRAVRKA